MGVLIKEATKLANYAKHYDEDMMKTNKNLEQTIPVWHSRPRGAHSLAPLGDRKKSPRVSKTARSVLG